MVWAGLRSTRTGVLAAPLQLTAAVTLLSVRQVQLADVQGTVTHINTTGYGFDAHTQRFDSFKQFGSYSAARSTGRSFTTNVGLLWPPWAALLDNLSAVQLTSRLRPQPLSTEAATLSLATRSTDAQGYLNC